MASGRGKNHNIADFLQNNCRLRKPGECDTLLAEGEGRKTVKKIAFICVHNSCRSQMAEAIGRHLRGSEFLFYSAGTQTVPRINPDAVRLIKARYGVDMEETQFSKTVDAIPAPDVAISMGCNVTCPYAGRPFDADWGLPDPTGKSDEEFCRIIDAIEQKIREL
ncbi:MAG: arsenate reductase ArsC [Christensenellaceae bacterium]|nr:arsenate reductase ArsC [Christensenellaceae bacterium]